MRSGCAPVAAKYIEDFFQSWLRTGTGSSTTVTTGLNASINKSLVWTKSRSAATNHKLTDTARGVTKALSSNTTGAEVTDSQGLTAFSSTGYTIGTNTDYNNSGATYVDWQWVATPKFFDVVTYTGTGSSRTVAHSLGSTPGCIIVKRTSGVENWTVYHRSQGANKVGFLNLTNAFGTNNTIWGNTSPTSTVFTVGDADAGTNANGSTYVAYIFAHDAGGFGLSGTDNVISCGSFTGSGGIDTVTLGYEPQWILMKNSTGSSNWRLMDTMRGMSYTNLNFLDPNTSNAEGGFSIGFVKPTPTGFTVEPGFFGTGATVIYIAIRRGPMKVPTDGTKVFAPTAYTGDNSSNRVIGSLPAGDSALVFTRNYNDYGYPQTWWNRLTGGLALRPYNTNAEVSQATTLGWDNQIGQLISVGSTNINYGGSPAGNFVLYNFKRAPSFFDEVCYAGDDGVYSTQKHSLGVAPELVIAKCRNASFAWQVWHSKGNVATSATGFGLNSLAAAAYPSSDFTPYMLATTFTPGLVYDESGNPANVSTNNYVAWLFATCPGVSKVGSYTGTGTTLQINCGFAAGARFVLIKRVDSTGAWYVWDSARGIVSGNDPYLLLNSTAAEVTSTDYIDTYSAGFELSSTAPAALNASGGTYIFLAIA